MASVSVPLPFEAYKGSEPYIFVSYAHKDGAVVYPLIRELHEQGYRIWYDEGIDPGNEWPKEIAKALSSASLFLVFFTGHAIQSNNVRNEISFALKRSKEFRAVYLEDVVLPDDLELRIGDIQAVLKWKLSQDHYLRSLSRALPVTLRCAPEPKPAPSPSAPASVPATVASPKTVSPVAEPAKRKGVFDFIRSVSAEAPKPAPKPAPPPKQAERRAGDTEAVDLGGGVKVDLVWCPAGSFLMGSPEIEAERSSKEMQHRVTLTKGFWIGKYAVTQRQWEAVAASNPSFFKGADLPVEAVSWDDCQTFIQKLNVKVAGGGFRLPTEAEWEYACRAGTTTAFCYGDRLDATMANFDENYPYSGAVMDVNRQKTTVVGLFKPNAWGLYDMHGNVCEWCQDWYNDYPAGNVTDPTGRGSGSSIVYRGGCFMFDAGSCRSARRCRYEPGKRNGCLGLRLVRSAP